GPMRAARSAWPSCPSAFRSRSRARCWSARCDASAAGRFRVHGRLHRPVELVARPHGRRVARPARPVRVGGDDEPALRVDEDALPEDAARHETAVAEGPPLVAVAPARHADVRLARRGFLEPALGHDGLAVRPGALEDEKAEAGEVARRGLDAAAADLAAG